MRTIIAKTPPSAWPDSPNSPLRVEAARESWSLSAAHSQPATTRQGIGCRSVDRPGPRRWQRGIHLAFALLGSLLASKCSLEAALPSTNAAAFYHLSLNDVDWVSESFPPSDQRTRGTRWQWRGPVVPYVILEQPGEGYLGHSDWSQNNGRSGIVGPPQTLSLMVTADAEVTGTVFWPRPDLQGMERFRFHIKPSQASIVASTDFYRSKAAHYRRLQQRNLPGTAWFRYQARQAEKQGGLTVAESQRGVTANNRERDTQLESTFALFTGGRAISENLQLDRLLNVNEAVSPEMEISELTGITVSEFDWETLVKDGKPVIDPLAKHLPVDQHAVLFPSFAALVAVIDEAREQGTPFLQTVEPQAQDARTLERYENQLCLPLSDLARTFGPHFVSSVAVTGSDPYLRTGSDVAILFQSPEPEGLVSVIRTRQSARRLLTPRSEEIRIQLEDVEVVGVRSVDRALSSYLARVKEVVVVSNSPWQLQKVLRTMQQQTPSLATSDEYRYFRQAFPNVDQRESAFLMVTDATIRRWCGPRWRIGASRRNRVAAVLAENQAAAIAEYGLETWRPTSLGAVAALPFAGEFLLDSNGVRSTRYGSLNFQTPIAELELDRVTQAEAAAYRQFRDRYQQSWRRFFDPIAVRVVIERGRLEAEIAVMPLIGGSDYRELVQVTRGSRIEVGAGDPHPEALIHWIMALDPESEPVRRIGNMTAPMVRSVNANALAWLGNSVSIYLDDHPLWSEPMDKGQAEQFVPEHWWRIPVAIRAEVKNPLGLAAFLSGTRAFVEQTAPGMTLWDIKRHGDVEYVRIRPGVSMNNQRELQEASIYYLVLIDNRPTSL